LTRAWLELLKPGCIRCWGDLRSVFIGHFQGTYTQLGNSWDLLNCRQRSNETLREYIQRFSKKHNELPNIADADVINAFIYGTTCEALVPVLSRETPRMTWELLDIATQYATGEEAIQTNFSDKAKATSHLNGGDGGDDPASSQRHCDRRNKDRKRRGEEMVAAADRATRP
jgi:hypothetical protein